MLKLITRSRIEGVILILFAAWYVREAHVIPAFFAAPGVPGPAVFPTILGIVLGITALFLIVSPGKILAGKKKIEIEDEEEDIVPSAHQTLWDKIVSKWHFGAMWGVLCGYLFLMPVIGFPVSTVLLLSIFFFLLGEKRPFVIVALSLTATAVMYLGFAKGLSLRLPLGIFDHLLK